MQISSKLTLPPLAALLATFSLLIINVSRAQDNSTGGEDEDWYTAEARLSKFKATRNQSDALRHAKLASRRASAPSNHADLLKIGETFFTPKQMEDTMNYFFLNEDDEKFGGISIKSFAHMGANVKVLSQATSDLFLHRYDTYRDMKLAAGPQTDQETCLRQLEYLAERTRYNLEHGFDSKDMNFLRYIDTFGRAPSGIYIGNAFWTGSYEECQRLHINLPGKERTGGRYCVMSFRFSGWPEDDPLEDILMFKIGTCLPKACDSFNYKNKLDLLVRIGEYNARQVDLKTVDPLSLYCLPDEQSEMRTWWRSTPTLVTVCLTAVWFLILAFATYKDEQFRQRDKSGRAVPEKMQKIYGSLSVTSNLRSLFSTGKSSLLEVASAAEGKPKEADKEREEAEQPVQQETIVDLDVIEGLKVLAAMYIISGHVIMISSQVVGNGRECATSTSILYTVSNLMPAFAVNTFFAITGILTSYLMFKQNRSHSFITSPVKWIAFILYRYLRIMPMYALVTLFCKHVARFTGDGPMWDYGTSSLAARRNCEQESWAWTLLFGANFKSPLKHCIVSAWYLANDFQFFIVTPIFLAALHLRPRLGKALLLVSVLVSYLAGIWSILESPASDLTPVATFMPHGFMVYVNFLHESYTRPYYRAPAYLIGLLLGHMLLEYELKRRAHLESRQASDHAAQDEEAPTWSSAMTSYGPGFLKFTVISTVMIPSVASRLPLTPTSARWLVAIFMPSYHIIYALSVGVYVLLSTTGHGSRTMDWLLSRHFWKPLSRLSLCVVLVNVEVISHIVQSSRDTKYLNNQWLASLNLYVLFWTYLVATLACVLFEAPVRAALNHLLAHAVSRVAAKSRLASKTKCQ